MKFRWAFLICAVVVAAASSLLHAGEGSPKISFKRTQLDNIFRSEGSAVGDFNHDGKLDISAGSVYYAAPDWKMVSVLDKPKEFNPLGYSDSFCNFASDVNGDGRTDLLVVDFPGKQTWWFEQPAEAGKPWTRHEITPVTNNESPSFLDLDGDGKREFLMGVNTDTKNPDSPDNRRMAFLKPDADPNKPWIIRAVSGPNAPSTTKFSHGIGAGDVNGDGRPDILVPQGWWQAPADKDQSEWEFHKAPFGDPCANMFAYDFDGDGDNDVLSSAAHQMGIWWYEQTKDGWVKHEIETTFSQTHSLVLVDMNGDKLPDFVTGKRYWAHGPKGDKNPGDPAVVFWYELTRKDGKPVWIPHQVDHDSGVGTQFEVADVNGDGLLDIVTANKKGAHYFQQVRE